MVTLKTDNKKTIVGFNTGHHAGISILHKNKLISISEERLNRRKYSDGYLNAFFYALNELGITVDDIDLFVSSSYHKPLPAHYMGQFKALGLPEEKFVTADHHLSHAYGSYFLSDFEKALVIVIDGLGNNTDTESYYVAEGLDMKKIGGNDAARSMYKGIGRAYESFTNYSGWSAQEAGKTMGLAPFGKEVAPGVELFRINEKNQIESVLEGKYAEGALKIARDNNLDFGKPFSAADNANAAWFVQSRLEDIVLELVRRLHKQTGLTKLSLGGGVFLNGIVNQRILDETPIEEISVIPCCDDTGQPLGNVLYGYYAVLGGKDRFELPNPYLGREYSEEEVLDVVERKQSIYALPYEVKSASFEYKKSDDIVEDVAGLLASGKIVGWFQGASEIGPRALGHRSILCAPFPAEMKDILNRDIKHRESFRPFAPSVLEEDLSKYFQGEGASPYMLQVMKSTDLAKKEIPAALHVDHTGRVQTVSAEVNDKYYELIRSFKAKTGVSVLLNTSFNDNGEPIIETPRDALVMFCKTPLQFLAIGDYLIWKPAVKAEVEGLMKAQEAIVA